MLDRLRRARDWVLDQVIEAGFGVLDWLTLPQETPVARAIREEGARLRKSFPTIVSTIRGRVPCGLTASASVLNRRLRAPPARRVRVSQNVLCGLAHARGAG
jgi:hypothetical protein